MTAATPEPAVPAPAATPLLAKLLNVLACPGEVFEELAAAPPRARNWLVPTLLAALASVALAVALAPNDQAAAAVGQIGGAGTVDILPAQRQVFSAMAITVAALAATGWSALMLWFIGRVFLGARFSYWKAVEVVGITGSIVVLGEVVTALMAAA